MMSPLKKPSTKPVRAADILDVPPEIAEELDRVYGADESLDPKEVLRDLNRRPPLSKDMVVLPPHYARFAIEPVHFIAANKLDWCAGNIVKYTARAEHKHGDKGLEDSMKVVRYAIMRAKLLLGDPDWWKPYRDDKLHGAIHAEITNGPRADAH